MKTNLELVDDADKFSYGTDIVGASGGPSKVDKIYALQWKDDQGWYPIGYMLARVVRELERAPKYLRRATDIDHTNCTVAMFQLSTEEERSRSMAELVGHWHSQGTFQLLRGWRNELWPVYGRRGELLFSMERTAVGLLGTMRYGVHMTAYVVDAMMPYGLKLWVPRRSADKSTFPGMLDNTVAGGLMTGEGPLECIIREADEEASLPDQVVRDGVRCAGTVTYIYVTDRKQVGESGFIYPECQWIYDLELPQNVIPKPRDGEVDEFRLCDVDKVKQDLADGKFKPNCALVLLDFFIRHGILTEDVEPDLATIIQRLHRKIPFPGPHQHEWQRAPCR